MRYFWIVTLPFVFVAGFFNLASGVVAFAWVVVVKLGIRLYQINSQHKSSRLFFYSLVLLVIVGSSYTFVTYGRNAVNRLPFVLVALLILWLVRYRVSEQRVLDIEKGHVVRLPRMCLKHKSKIISKF